MNQPQDRRLSGIVHVHHIAIGSVHRKYVLDQIVCSQTDEIHFVQEPVDGHGDGGNLHHDAQGYVPSERNMAFREVLHHFCPHEFRLAQLCQRADHGKHHLHVAAHAGPQNCPQLRLKERQIAQREANTS